MRNKIVLGVMLATSLLANAKDPVLMTINGNEIKLSEFEYLYNKNNKQQLEKESLNDYVERFVDYKLKVYDAEKEGLDTLASFKNEFEGYKKDLMRPYLENNSYSKPFAKEAYERMKKNLEVSHIMLPQGFTEEENAQNKARIDSIRNCVLKGEDFGALAKQFSTDTQSAMNNGKLGNMWVGLYPYSFENAAYNTKIGEISPVVETQYGYHIIKVTGEHPTCGKYHVAHLIKYYNRGDIFANIAIDAEMDSIYNVLNNGGDFAAVAKKESDDTRSAKNGGELGWFGVDQLLDHLNEAMLNTPVGSVSQPIKAEYGVHIIKVLAHKPLESYEEKEAELIAMVNRDERAKMINNERISSLKKEFKYKYNTKADKLIREMLVKNNGYDSAFVNSFKEANILIFTYVGGKVNSLQIAEKLNVSKTLDVEAAVKYISEVVDQVSKDSMFDFEKVNLENKYPEYVNLLNEYREGMLLFEISNRKVWDKAGKDESELDKIFEENKSKYQTWIAPKFKGVIIYSVNDSIENEVKNYAATLGGDTILTSLHKKFRRDIRIEKHLTAQGENAFVDELIFNGKKADQDKKYTTYFVYEGKLIDQPEEANDVRGQVTTDYQAKLEKEWIDDLRVNSKVSINKKVLKSVKEND